MIGGSILQTFCNTRVLEVDIRDEEKRGCRVIKKETVPAFIIFLILLFQTQEERLPLENVAM